jgi:hypothetical protein
VRLACLAPNPQAVIRFRSDTEQPEDHGSSFNCRVEPVEAPPLSAYRWLNRSLQVLVVLFGLYGIGMGLQEARERYASFHPARPPLYGVWSVDEFVVDGKDVPCSPIPSDGGG